MFSKRLRFSILLTIITLFYQITNLSFAQVLQSSVYDGWTEQNLDTYPPKVNDESYLYYAGKTSDLNGLKLVIKSIPTIDTNEKLSLASVAFDYWGYGGTAETDGLSTSLFSVGVSFRSEAKPETEFAFFNSSYLAGDSWGSFYFIDDQPVYPARIMITPNLASTTTSEPYYVALKAIEVIYYIDKTETITESQIDSTTGVETNVTREEKTTRNVTFTCSSSKCSDFDIVNGATLYWSDMFFPTKPNTFTKFLTPNSGSTKPYQLILNKEDDTDVCVILSYWLTEGANLTVQIDSTTSTFVLSPTYSLQTSTSIDLAYSKYDWYSIRICLTNFTYKPTAGAHTLSLIPGAAGNSEYIAVAEVLSSDITAPAMQDIHYTTKIILQSWTKIEPTNEWHYLPSVGSLSDDGHSILFSSVANGYGIIYLYSNWFNYTTEDLELRQTMGITSCPPHINVQLKLIDEENNIVATQDSGLCETSDKKISNQTYIINQGTLNGQYRLEFVIEWTQGVNPAILTLSKVDLSDACRDGEATCSNHGICVVPSPNQYVCQCDSGYMRSECQKPDWCVLTFNETDATTSTTSELSGSSYCTSRSGTCNSETFDPEMRKICDCGTKSYWKYDNTLGHSCAALDPCTGIDVFCSAGYICQVDATTNEATCSACDTANGYAADSNGNCVKTSPCDVSPAPCLTGASCTAYENSAVCYCANGVTYSTTTGCDSQECSLDTREELGCSQSCETQQGKAVCTCLSGYELIENTTECISTFNCTLNCSTSEQSICLLNGNIESCSCLPGYVLISQISESTTGESTTIDECIDICTAAALNNTEAIDQVKSICGTSTCSMENSKLTCSCSSPYVNGSDGRCHIETACLTGGRGHTECSARGAMCKPKLQALESGQDLWECICPIGTTEASDKMCVDQCSINEKSCLFDNAVCQKSLTLGAKNHDCVCQPGLKKNETDGRCYLIEHSLRVEMVSRLEESMTTLINTQQRLKVKSFYMSAPAITDTCPYYSPLDISGCVDYLNSASENMYNTLKPALMEKAIREALITNLKTDLSNVYGSTFDEISVIDYSKLNSESTSESTSLAGDYKVILALELTDPDTETSLIPLNDTAVCHSLAETVDGTSSYCVIPTHSVLQRSSIYQGELLPCTETLIDYCPANTQCKTLDYSRFSCDCNSGFRAETIIQMDSEQRLNYYKEYCEDIDECSTMQNPCREHSTCINTIGGYICPCNHEYIEDSTTGMCLSVCSTVTCVYGECIVIANNTGSCRCNEGYRGDTCEEQDPMVTTFRTALITVAVVLGLLLIGVVLVSVILIKKTKRSAMKNNAERPMAEYGRPQVPKKYQDNSGFTND